MSSKYFINYLAHQAAASPKNDTTIPTENQIKAGNYKKGHLRLHGLPISIENPKGSVRSGIDSQGKKWQIRLRNHYGYINNTIGKDKDHLDIFIGSNPDGKKIYVVNQKNSDGNFDEHKILLGWDSFPDAVKGYLSNYEDGWDMIQSVHQSDVDNLKDWIKNGNTKIPYK